MATNSLSCSHFHFISQISDPRLFFCEDSFCSFETSLDSTTDSVDSIDHSNNSSKKKENSEKKELKKELQKKETKEKTEEEKEAELCAKKVYCHCLFCLRTFCGLHATQHGKIWKHSIAFVPELFVLYCMECDVVLDVSVSDLISKLVCGIILSEIICSWWVSQNDTYLVFTI